MTVNLGGVSATYQQCLYRKIYFVCFYHDECTFTGAFSSSVSPLGKWCLVTSGKQASLHWLQPTSRSAETGSRQASTGFSLPPGGRRTGGGVSPSPYPSPTLVAQAGSDSPWQWPSAFALSFVFGGELSVQSPFLAWYPFSSR